MKSSRSSSPSSKKSKWQSHRPQRHRRIRQRFARRIHWQEEKRRHKENTAEWHALENQEKLEIEHIQMGIRLAFGYIADSALTPSHNAFNVLCNMPAWYYFDRPSHLAFHDLTTLVSPPKNLRSLLGLGLKFCPTPCYTTYNLNPTLNRFKRDLWLKTFFAGNPLEANDTYTSKMYVKSSWTPPDWNIPWGVQQ